MDSEVYRASRVLRVILTSSATLGAAAAAKTVWIGYSSGSARLIVGALTFLVVAPLLLAAAAIRRSIEIRADSIRSVTLLGSKTVPWTRIRRVDQTRSSFIIETELGPISAGWIAVNDRERLLKQVIERANLGPAAQEPGWGIVARYVPRTTDIKFVPHHARRQKTDSQ